MRPVTPVLPLAQLRHDLVAEWLRLADVIADERLCRRIIRNVTCNVMIRINTKSSRIKVLAMFSVLTVAIPATGVAAGPDELALKSFPATSRRDKSSSTSPDASAKPASNANRVSPQAPVPSTPSKQPSAKTVTIEQSVEGRQSTAETPAKPATTTNTTANKATLGITAADVSPQLFRVERLPVVDLLDSAGKAHTKFADLAPSSSRRRHAPLAVTPKQSPAPPPKPALPENESGSEFAIDPLPVKGDAPLSIPNTSQPATFAPNPPSSIAKRPQQSVSPNRATTVTPEAERQAKTESNTPSTFKQLPLLVPQPNPTTITQQTISADESNSTEKPASVTSSAPVSLPQPSFMPAHQPVVPTPSVATTERLDKQAVENHSHQPANVADVLPKLDSVAVQPPVAGRKAAPSPASQPLVAAPRQAITATTPAPPATSDFSPIRPPALPVESYVKAATRIAKPRLEYAVSLAQRGAYYSAREELRQALWTIAQAHDTETESYYYTKALDSAFLAFKECDDLASILGPGISRERLNRVIGQHKTPIAEVPKDEHSALAALRQYVQFAEDALVTAAGGEKFAAELLYTFARITQTDKSMDQSTLVNAKSISLYRASLRIDDRHVASANELAVMLGTFGHLFEAREILAQATHGDVPREVWQNLAAVHDRLGDHQRSQQALNQSKQASRNPAVQVTWVEHATFAGQIPSQNELETGTKPGDEANPTATQKKPSWTQKLFGSRFGSSKKQQRH